MKHLILIPTTGCNLACRYCWQNDYEVRDMSVETASQAIEAYKDNLERISFFGGEPMLRMPLIRAIVEKYPSCRYGITTNGTLMTADLAHWFAEHKFSFVVSIDGPAHIHNRNRVGRNKAVTHSSVLTALNDLRRAGVKDVSLRATFTREQVGDLLEIAEYLNGLCDEGFGTNVSVEPVSQTEGCVTATVEAYSPVDLIGLSIQYAAISRMLVKRIRDGKPARFKNIMTYFSRLQKQEPVFCSCGAGLGMLTIGPDGELFACHRISDATRVGFLGSPNVPALQEWQRTTCTESPQCVSCSVFGICGGPCREQSSCLHRRLDAPTEQYCEFTKMWIKAADAMMRALK